MIPRLAAALSALWMLACGEPTVPADATDAGPEASTEPAPFPEGIAEAEPEFENFDGSTRCTLAKRLEPESVEEAVAAVRWGIDAGYGIKAVSSSASHSEQDIICPPSASGGGVMINFARMNRVLSIDAEAMEVRVEPGAKMGDVGDALHEAGFGLLNHIPLRDVTAAGAIATGAHHTSLRFPSGIHDMVTRIVLIDGLGDLQVLEGAEAKGAAAHLGVLGAIVEVGFEIQPQFKLRARVTSGDASNLEHEILEMAAAHDYASLSWFVSQGTWTLRQTDILPADAEGEAWSTNWHSSAEEQALLAQISDELNRAPDGESQMCAVAGLRAGDDSLSHADAEGPSEGEAIGWSHRIFSSTCEGLACPWKSGVRIFNPEVAIAVEDLPAWMARVRELYAKRPFCFPLNGIVIRFSKAGQSLVGMNAGKDVAMVEWHISRHPDEGVGEPFSDVYDEIHQMTLAEFEGRPHWGKNYAASFVGLDPASRYEGWAQFEALRARLDPAGVFENDFWAKVSGRAGYDLAPACATDRRCWCEADAHCGPGWTCEGGLVYADARVCRRQGE